MGKTFVEIIAEHSMDGSTKPITIKWEDGRIFDIDRVLDVTVGYHNMLNQKYLEVDVNHNALMTKCFVDNW